MYSFLSSWTLTKSYFSVSSVKMWFRRTMQVIVPQTMIKEQPRTSSTRWISRTRLLPTSRMRNSLMKRLNLSIRRALSSLLTKRFSLVLLVAPLTSTPMILTSVRAAHNLFLSLTLRRPRLRLSRGRAKPAPSMTWDLYLRRQALLQSLHSSRRTSSSETITCPWETSTALAAWMTFSKKAPQSLMRKRDQQVSLDYLLFLSLPLN